MEFDDFLRCFVEKLAVKDFYQGRSFTAYLSLPSEQRSNDEADVVDDKIAGLLLEALGYPQSEWVYNRGGQGGQKPDYLVKIPNYPRPPFVLEDKNTTIDDLPSFAGRLERYIRAVGAPLGALLNGGRLLAYELTDTGLLSLFDVSVTALVETWRGESLLSAGRTGKQALSGR